MKIKALFDPAKNINRSIEKVITYDASEEARLRAEISEYIVTDSIEAQLHGLLLKMQAAMDMGDQNEIGVWVSGFYGSGKSSFTKYLGLALDERAHLDGERFLTHLQNRLNKPQTKALLKTIATRYPAVVVMLDLASDMLVGATMAEISTVLYLKVLQWAGYSQNLKVAAFERMLKKDGRYQEFTGRILQELSLPWEDVKNSPLVLDSLLPTVVHEMYPQLFKSPVAFSTATADFFQFEKDRVKEMINIAREASGKEHILFIVDEVGQYIAPRPNLILNLDGLAKNLKNLGNGKVWLFGTAQQTLTEDDPKATLNSPQLFKLKDRFPIQIELESSDIKEICYRRLLGKSAEGEKVLGKLFDAQGAALRHNVKLADSRVYNAGFDKQTFINLYPFLPAHFDILLHLLGALAKSTGGIGLRSAIKVVQDILIEGASHQSPAADQEVGWLATSVTLYDALERDINRAFGSVHAGVEKAKLHYPDSPLHQGVAKTVAVLQILSNMPATPANIAALMHPSIEAASLRDDVERAANDLKANAFVPVGEKEGGLCFFSERLNDIDQQRARLPLSEREIRRHRNEALQDVFRPLPTTRLHGSFAVTAGLKAAYNNTEASLEGERNSIQLVVELVEPHEYESRRLQRVDDSRQRTAQHVIYLLGRASQEIEDKLADIYRCQEIVRNHRNDPEQDVRDYCNSQTDRANRLTGELKAMLARSFGQGSFVFRGRITSADSLDPDVQEAARKLLADVAGEVFDRYAEAPARAETGLAEKLLRQGNLRSVTSSLDPLGLVEMHNGSPRVRHDHKALISIRDYIDRNGAVDGKRLTDVFGEAPYGWSPDTLRYLMAALLIAGEIKLKVSGREITANGNQAIEALRNNNSFKAVGVSLRNDRPSIATLSTAAKRLEALTGEQVIPLEDEISKAARRYLGKMQSRNATLASSLNMLSLPGAAEIASMNREIDDVLATDASDAPQRFGAETSALYDNLVWAGEAHRALQHDLENTVREVQAYRHEIETLPDVGVPGELRKDLADTLAAVDDRLRQRNFFQHVADLNSALTRIKARTRDAVAKMDAAQLQSIEQAQSSLQYIHGWMDVLEQSERQAALGKLEALRIEATPDLHGLKQLLNQEYRIQGTLRELREPLENTIARRRAEKNVAPKDAPLPAQSVRVPARVASLAELTALIARLQALQSQMSAGEFEIKISVDE
jgi:hypothetical protein